MMRKLERASPEFQLMKMSVGEEQKLTIFLIFNWKLRQDLATH